MPQEIPRPAHAPAFPNHQLVAGIPLEQGRTWAALLWFTGLCFPLLWLLLWLILLLWRPSMIAAFDALAWSLPATLALAVLYFFLAPVFTPSRRLLLRNDTLSIVERGTARWAHDLDQPFFASLLYRDHREDGLLIFQPEEGATCFLYGRFPQESERPPRAIPVSPLGFSLAEEALDRFGAYMMPDKNALHLPQLTQAIAAAEGFAQAPLRLPLRTQDAPMRLAQSSISWQTQGGLRGTLPYRLASLQPFRTTSNEDGATQLMLCLERDPTLTTPDLDATPDRPFPPFWIRIEWPRSLSLNHLPHASPLQQQQAIVFSPIDAVLLLDQFARRGVLHAPFALLQSNNDANNDTIPDLS